MLLGVDFDNTIVCYDKLFHRLAIRQQLIPSDTPATKESIRDYLRRAGKEDAWTELQGYVYGARMAEASPFPGTLDFFLRCKQRHVSICIISHKTRYPFIGPTYDLHQAAQDWLVAQGFYDPEQIGLRPDQVHFELTKQEKLLRIRNLGCSYFIDDLPEFLTEPDFPPHTKPILFDPGDNHLDDHQIPRASTWAEVEALIKWE